MPDAGAEGTRLQQFLQLGRCLVRGGNIAVQLGSLGQRGGIEPELGGRLVGARPSQRKTDAGDQRDHDWRNQEQAVSIKDLEVAKHAGSV